MPTTSLAASPIYPSSVSWCNDTNLLAVASGHIVTILNPALPHGPRGIITLSQDDQPLSPGTLQTGDQSTFLLSIRISHGTQPNVQAISWSPPILAHSSGCLLSVCTNKGRIKLYTFPYSRFCAEWTEVVDISKMLRDYYIKTNFTPGSSESLQDFDTSESVRETEIRKSTQGFNNEAKKEKGEYALRCALLSSLTSAWSPILNSFSKSSLDSINCIYGKSAVLAVGGKSGHISFWRITGKSQSHNSDDENVSVQTTIIGLLHAHNSWVTTICWIKYEGSSPTSQLVLATGSSDGSVNLWMADVKGLLKYSEDNGACFSLLNKLSPVTSIPISTISMVVSNIVLDEIVLAVGTGRGSLEAWICHISNRKFQRVDNSFGHDKVVTGLQWDIHGRRLYSCGQDGSLHILVRSGSSLCESSQSSESHNQGTNNDKHSDPCFGLALSPGCLILVLVHGLDSRLLNPMYEAQTQKAALQFFWICGCQSEVLMEKDINICGRYGLSKMELSSWESDLLNCLKKYENVQNELVLWDVLESLRSFRQHSLELLVGILGKLFLSWFLHLPPNLCIEKVLLHILGSLPSLNTRKLHLINIICRRLMLVEVLPDRWSGLDNMLDDRHDCENDKHFLWKNLLSKSERELNERRLAFVMKSFLYMSFQSSALHSANACWLRFSVALMDQWVAINERVASDKVKRLASEVKEIRNRLSSSNKNILVETCGFCSTSVSFVSPEYGCCMGAEVVGNNNKTIHKLLRCSFSMKICNIESTLWVCMCCKRIAERLAPGTFFTMSMSSLDVEFAVSESDMEECLKPLCPFCGILLRRSQPDFFLSLSLV